MSKNNTYEALVLEELFYDQLEFGVSAILKLQPDPHTNMSEINDLLTQLTELTIQNISLMESQV